MPTRVWLVMANYVTSQHVADLLMRLVDACRDTQFTFEIAAGGVPERLLKAELLQYSGQRREFVADLLAALRVLGDRIVSPGSLDEPLRRNSSALREAVENHAVVPILLECERTEADAQSAYQEALSESISPALHSLIQSQLAAIGRIHHRLRRLRANARSERN